MAGRTSELTLESVLQTRRELRKEGIADPSVTDLCERTGTGASRTTVNKINQEARLQERSATGAGSATQLPEEIIAILQTAYAGACQQNRAQAMADQQTVSTELAAANGTIDALTNQVKELQQDIEKARVRHEAVVEDLQQARQQVHAGLAEALELTKACSQLQVEREEHRVRAGAAEARLEQIDLDFQRYGSEAGSPRKRRQGSVSSSRGSTT